MFISLCCFYGLYFKWYWSSVFQLAVALLQLLKNPYEDYELAIVRPTANNMSTNVSKLFHYFIGYFPLLNSPINGGWLLPITVSFNCALVYWHLF